MMKDDTSKAQQKLVAAIKVLSEILAECKEEVVSSFSLAEESNTETKHLLEVLPFFQPNLRV